MRSTGRFLTGIGLFLLFWEIWARWVMPGIILPELGTVGREMMSLLGQAAVYQAALQTLWKVLLALGLVLVLGIILGLLLGLSTAFYQMMRPIIMIIQAVPVVSWLSLVIFAWGIGWRGPIFIAFLSLLPMALLTTVSGVSNLDRKLLEMARVYQVPSSRVIKDIYLGSLIPFIVAIVDVSIGQTWKVILVAEYLCGNSGLGVEILSARYYVNIPRVYALTLLAVALGLITERLIKLWLGRISHRWQPA
ncbi:MAG: ABC transporter permease [Deltaproteobacteria bacterium]